MKPYKTLLATLVLLSLMGITVIHVKAQGPIEAEILPSQGSANTVILLRFSTVNASVGNVQTADIFWDDSNIALNQEGVLGADGSYNYNLTVPTEPPLSTVGNHTIRVDSTVFNYGPVSFNFTFNITEFVPSQEYLDLNATYNSLLANYTSLLDNYTQLLANFNETSTAYATLLIQANQLNQSYNTLIANYNSLIANYNSLAANYNQQEINYNSLQQTFTSLATNYTSLQNSLTSLTSNYNNLTENYNSLNQTYASLLSNYDAARNQLTFSTNLNYTLIATTITLAAIIIYLIILKPKTPTRTR
jgi:methyl-accepting chemotaxis protein